MDSYVASQQGGSLANPAQAMMVFRYAGGVKADAPVFNINMDAAAVMTQRNPRLLALAMSSSVGQTLLNDAENCAFQFRRQTLESRGMFKGNLRIGRGFFLDQMFDRRHNAQFVQDRRP